MNAAVSSPASPRPSVRSSRPRKAASKVQSSTQAAIAEITIETTSKLVISTLLGCVAIVSLGTLIPLAQLNSAKLKELTRELSATQTRVDHQQNLFNRNFDPVESRNVTQDVQYRVNRQEVPIIQISQ
jgi:ABC-type protease/lipase transport system fused ATPase/permease subunit